MENMKKLFVLIAASVCLASCTSWDSGGNNSGNTLTQKYVKYIETGDGAQYTFSYNTMNYISNVSYIDFMNPGDQFSYDIDYNTTTIDIESGSDLWIMRFNGLGSLDKLYKATGSGEELLSSFSYFTPANYITQLSSISSDNNKSNAAINWISFYAIGSSRNTVTVEEEGVEVTYSTSITFTYDDYISNIHANFNFFYFLVPELLEVSKLDNVVAAAVSIIGSRCYYLPTKVTVEKKKITLDGTEPVEKTERTYSYDCDDNGYVDAIYSGSGDSKQLLYAIKYFKPSTDDDSTETQE